MTIDMNATVEQIATEAVKPKAKRTSTTPKLVCNVTGIGRYTNAQYLENKAKERNCTIEEILGFYVSKEVAKMLREGKRVKEIQATLSVNYNSPVEHCEPETILRYNGKQKKK
jgi:hypothetical protein